ncbi:hypothetical protein Pmani_025268 [Petrolisthes manimaculis]|uniref:Band 7 domain-containing protein n=1 Tax=Petrolisthes manimaculis TaxID=1843537 RepID=A0AAE1P6H2_9EUCA|nr:hypothetical protein Pmani_025268 [Petrolisthes manimaculis]
MVIPVFLTCGPNEVLVVSGLGYKKPAMVAGGRLVAFPCVQRWNRMSLNVMTLKIDSPGVYTAQGVAIKVTGVAQVKISTQHPEVLALACEHFLEKTEHQVEQLLTSTLEGHQRGIMGTMSVEDIYRNRKLFNERVFEVASKDLYNMGIQVLSYTIRDLNDEQGYLAALGRAQTAQVQRDAKIGEVEANRDARIEQCLAQEQLLKAKYANDIDIAKSNRAYQVQKAIYDQEVQARQAESDLAFELQSCITKQKVKEENMETLVVEKKAKILVEEQELHRKQMSLDATIRKPAEAEKFRAETLAKAEKQKVLLEAEARSEAIKLKGEALAGAQLARAEADAIKIRMKAEAFKEYKNAAILSMYLDTMPKMVAEVGSTLSQAKAIKMVSSGDSEIGAKKLTQEVMDIATSVPKLVESMTGVDIQKTLRSV